MDERWRDDERHRWAEPGPWDRPAPARGRRYGRDDPEAEWTRDRGDGWREEGRSFRPGRWPQDEEQRAWGRYAGGYGEYGRGYGGRSERGYGLDREPRPERRRGYTGFSGYGSEMSSDYYGAGERGGYGYDRDHRGMGSPGGQGHGGGYEGSRGGGRDWWDKASDEVRSWFGDEAAERRRDWDHVRGEHHGRGPKGYVRSDDRIREDVNDRLTYDGWLDATNIDVLVDKAEVTLTGTVADRADRRRAEDIAEAVHGVKHVQNNLRVEDRSQENRAMGPTVSGSKTGRVM